MRHCRYVGKPASDHYIDMRYCLSVGKPAGDHCHYVGKPSSGQCIDMRRCRYVGKPTSDHYIDLGHCHSVGKPAIDHCIDMRHCRSVGKPACDHCLYMHHPRYVGKPASDHCIDMRHCRYVGKPASGHFASPTLEAAPIIHIRTVGILLPVGWDPLRLLEGESEGSRGEVRYVIACCWGPMYLHGKVALGDIPCRFPPPGLLATGASRFSHFIYTQHHPYVKRFREHGHTSTRAHVLHVLSYLFYGPVYSSLFSLLASTNAPQNPLSSVHVCRYMLIK
jgi:hypothetical protein